MRLNILAFALGVFLLQYQPELPSSQPYALAGGLLAAALPWLPRNRWRRVLAAIACLALGFAWAAWRAESRLADALPEAWIGQDVELVGVVATLPQTFEQGTRFELDVEQVMTPNARIPARILLSSYVGRSTAEFAQNLMVRPGERWRLTARLRRPHGNANPGGFDYEVWLLERGIRATGYVRPEQPERLAPFVWRPGYAIEHLRLSIREAFQQMLPAPDYPWAGILVALAIGDQKAIDGPLWTVFNRTGTTHLMAISGLHVTLVAALLGWLVSFGWRRVPELALRMPAQRAGLMAGCGAALVYALLAGFGVPAQRTVYMLLVAAAAMGSGRVIAPSRVLGLALLVVLLIDPWAVLAAGFWLSFGVVAALLYVGSARQGRPGSRWEAVRNWGLVQWAATLASLPILLLVFQQLSLVSPLANAVAIPVVSFVVTPLVLCAAIIPWWPIAALAHAVMSGLMVFLAWCATWPVWQAAAPPLGLALMAALGVLVCLIPRGVPGRWLGVFMIAPALLWAPPRPPAGEVWVSVLDVGQGLASVIRTREHTMIYDPGPLYSAESDAGQRVVVPYLRYLGMSAVDLLVVTHRDSDHSGGTAAVQAALDIRETRSSIPGLGTPCLAGQSWTWDGVRFAVLHPADAVASQSGKANHVSCVIAVEAGGRRMLLTSDIEAADETALLQRGADALRADVLLVPHHGSKTSSTPDFLAAVRPSVAIVPVGYRNRFGHPKAEVMARYEALGAEIWRTDRDGEVRVELGEDALRVRGWRASAPRYWFGR